MKMPFVKAQSSNQVKNPNEQKGNLWHSVIWHSFDI
jgi:hypothetical protein